MISQTQISRSNNNYKIPYNVFTNIKGLCIINESIKKWALPHV